MKTKDPAVRYLVAAFCIIGLLGSPTPVVSQHAPVITADGSSSVFPITEAAAAEFRRERSNPIQVTVKVSGTGGGFRKFCRGEPDIQDASRPILREEMEACRKAGVQYIELPIAFDALTIAVSPANTWVRSMTVAELRRMWEPTAQGQLVRWSQIRQGWPDAPFKLYGAATDSGTFDYFSEAIVGKPRASRADYSASEDDNVIVRGIASDPNTFGCIPFAYFEANKRKLKAVAIDGGNGAMVPLLETVVKGRYSRLSRPLFLYVSSQAADRREVREFVAFYLQNAGKLAAQVKYIPLTDRAYVVVRDRFEGRKVGTAFGGEAAIGLHVDEIVSRSPKQ